MVIDQSGIQEQYETSQVNYSRNSSARKESSDSGVGNDIEGGYGYSTDDTEPLIPKSKSKNSKVISKTSDDIHAALRAIKKGKQKFEKWQKKSSVDISNIRDEKENNILHRIALLKKKQKCRSLNVLVEKISKEDLEKLVNSENQDRKTPLQVALIDKITKGKHRSHTIQSNDNTLKFLVALLKHGVKPGQLELPKETLQDLDEKHRKYYLKFLEKLAESVRQSTLEQKIDIEEIKKITARITNTPDGNGNYLLHSAIKNKDEKLFKELLQKEADISLKGTSGNNALHLIFIELKKERRLKFFNILLEICQKEFFIRAVNDKNDNSQTPLHQVLQRIQEKSEKSSLGNKIQNIVKKEFNATGRYQTLELFLQNGADISKRDGEDNNALHYIVSFKGKQRVACLQLTLDKDEFSNAVNATNKKGQTPLHQLLQYIGEKSENRSLKKFEQTNRYKALELLLQNGANITAQDKEGNNALHYIASLKGKQKVACLDLILGLVKEKKVPEDQLSNAVNAKGQEGKTPMQTALIAKATKDTHNPTTLEDNTIKFCKKLLEKDANPNQLKLPESSLSQEQEAYYRDFKRKLNKSVQKSGLNQEIKNSVMIETVEPTNQNIGEFNKFLQSGYDITGQDTNGNNILHNIALLERGQKATHLKSILDSVKERKIEDQFRKATDTTNKEGRTPLQVALIKKAEKGERLKSEEYQYQKSFFDNTVKFCAKLLKNGADPNFLWLEDEKFHTTKYYTVLLNLKDNQKIPQEARDKAKEFTEKLEARYHCRTTCKWPSFWFGTITNLVGIFMKKTGNGLKAAWKCIDPGRRARVLLAITAATTIITMVTLSCFQGQIAIGAALPIIAITGVVCLIFTLGFSGIKKSLKEFTTDEQGMSKDENNDSKATKQDKVSKNDAQRNLENEHKDSKKQELQKLPDQPEHTKGSPSPEINDVSIFQFTKENNEQINKPSSLAL